jgi:ABC-type sugar transport system substrate-binding protein
VALPFAAGGGGKGIGLFLQTERNDYQKLQEYDAFATAHRLGLAVERWFADGDADAQARQLEAFIVTSRPGAVAIVDPVDGAALAPAAARAVHAGLGWIALDRPAPYLEELRRRAPAQLLAAVSTDQREIGRVQGRQFQALLRGPKRVLYLRGPQSLPAAEDRLAGMAEVLAGSAFVPEVAASEAWTEAGGDRAMSAWLTAGGPAVHVDLVGCQNDALAAGAVRALTRVSARLNRPELGLVRVTGVDGNPHFGKALVDQGRFTATVIVPPLAGRAVELAHALWTERRQPAALVLLDVRSYPELGALPGR